MSALAGVAAIAACSSTSSAPAASPGPDAEVVPVDAASPTVPQEDASGPADASAGDAADAAVPRRAIKVDATDPRRHDFTFTAKQADAAATQSLGTQGAYLDTRVKPAGKLVVYLHGASAAALANCANGEVATLLATEGFHGFTHAADPQHAGHLVSFQDLNVPGAPTSVDGASAPYGNSHRLQSSARVTDGHGSTTPGGTSPKVAGAYVYAPVWATMFGR